MTSHKGVEISDGQTTEIGIGEQEQCPAILPRHGILPASPTAPPAELHLKRRRAVSLEDADAAPQDSALEDSSSSVDIDSEGFEIYEHPDADTPTTVEILNTSETESPPTPDSPQLQAQVNPQQPVYSLSISMDHSSTLHTNTPGPSSSLCVFHTVTDGTEANFQEKVAVSSQEIESVRAGRASDEPYLSRVKRLDAGMEYQIIDDQEIQVRRNRFLRLRDNRFLRPIEASGKHVKEVIRSPPKKPRSTPLHNHGDRSAKKTRQAVRSRQEDSDKENWDPEQVV